MTTTHDYSVAKDHLTEVEKDRIVCVYLNSLDPNNVEWESASNQYGSAFVASFKKGMSNTMKKLKDVAEAAANGTPVTPAKTPNSAKTPKSSAKKRKSTTETPEGEEGDEGVTPTPKKRGRKPKKAATPEEKAPTPNAEVNDEEGAEVKGEERED